MCEFCYQYPCNVSCPYSDEEAVTSCDICNGKIVDSSRYLLDGYTVCKGCIDEYVNDCSQQEF